MSTGPRSKGTVIVFGIAFWYPLAGVTWQFLHYLLGLRALGYDAWYVEDSGRWIYDPALNDLSPDASANVAAVAAVLDAHGFGDRWVFRGRYPDGRCFGATEDELRALYRRADAFLNVTGSQELCDEHLDVPLRIYVESDPFPQQVRADAGDAATLEMLRAHHALFTFGELVGSDECVLPTGGFTWLPTRQPVAVDLWHSDADTSSAPMTTITTWHNKGKDVEWRGDTWYWTKDREFTRFLDLPSRVATPLELAVGRDDEVERLLRGHGWRVANSVHVSRDVDRYRDYIRGSKGEFTVARDQYVRPRTGWFSDRSACYLAAGRPVITEDTGFGARLPTGEGLFAFTTMDDAVAALDAVDADHARHCAAAADIAREHFAADRVVASVLARAGA